MKFTRLLGAALVIMLVASPFAAFAQDDELKMKEYVSDDELLAVSYPEDWIVVEVEDADMPLPSVFFANSEEAGERLNTDEDMVSGDAAIVVMLFPLDLMALMAMELPEDASPAELAELFTASMEGDEADEETESEATEEAGGTQIGEAEEVELTDELTAGYVTISDEEAEGAYIIYKMGEDLLAITAVAAYPGEFTDELVDAGKAVAASIVYTGSAEDLMLTMMGGAMEVDTPTDEETLDGESLVAERCTTCHDAKRIEKVDEDEAGWTEIVDRMIASGAELNDAEREAVIAYLVATY